jgi:uncharacterized membrane protein
MHYSLYLYSITSPLNAFSIEKNIRVSSTTLHAMVNDGISRVKQAYAFLRLAAYCAAAKLRGSRRAKRILYTAIITTATITGAGALYAAALFLAAGIQLILIPEPRARLLAAGILSLALAVAYGAARLWRWLWRWAHQKR